MLQNIIPFRKPSNDGNSTKLKMSKIAQKTKIVQFEYEHFPRPCLRNEVFKTPNFVQVFAQWFFEKNMSKNTCSLEPAH